MLLRSAIGVFCACYLHYTKKGDGRVMGIRYTSEFSPVLHVSRTPNLLGTPPFLTADLGIPAYPPDFFPQTKNDGRGFGDAQMRLPKRHTHVRLGKKKSCANYIQLQGVWEQKQGAD